MEQSNDFEKSIFYHAVKYASIKARGVAAVTFSGESMAYLSRQELVHDHLDGQKFLATRRVLLAFLSAGDSSSYLFKHFAGLKSFRFRNCNSRPV